MGIPSNVEALWLKRSRNMTQKKSGAVLIPDVTISEMHADHINVTRHPVDSGANITDHAFVEPAQLHCVFGWSDQSVFLNSIIGNVKSVVSGGSFKKLTTTKDVYAWLLEAMNKRELFDVSTGKRKYENMLIVDLQTTSTVETESALIVEVGFQQMNIVSTQETTLSAALQKEPQKTAPPTNRGEAVPFDSAHG